MANPIDYQVWDAFSFEISDDRNNERPAVVLSRSMIEYAVRSELEEMIKRETVASFNTGLVSGYRNAAYLRDLVRTEATIFSCYHAGGNDLPAELPSI